MQIISGLRMWMRCFHLNSVFTTGLQRMRRTKESSSKSLAKTSRSSGTRSTSSSKATTKKRDIKEKLKMAAWHKASFMNEKHTGRYQAEKLKLEEKVAKSMATTKVFEELE